MAYNYKVSCRNANISIPKLFFIIVYNTYNDRTNMNFKNHNLGFKYLFSY